MPLQTASTCEFLRTLAAIVIMYTSVCCHMPFQVTRSKTPLPTNLTLVRIVASVCGFVDVDSGKLLAAVQQTCVATRCRESELRNGAVCKETQFGERHRSLHFGYNYTS